MKCCYRAVVDRPRCCEYRAEVVCGYVDRRRLSGDGPSLRTEENRFRSASRRRTSSAGQRWRVHGQHEVGSFADSSPHYTIDNSIGIGIKELCGDPKGYIVELPLDFGTITARRSMLEDTQADAARNARLHSGGRRRSNNGETVTAAT
eukprot:TRINITY_DN1696_c1_g1_i2.p2 TRINITY_DN1696_c1_g1~~TRINITY_DN1696_c1_g1_i2.p2  ORF type:complete len:148 (-),score=14.07 TRINITY_DN1696_c1_g1_i2:1203-1646(-)